MHDGRLFVKVSKKEGRLPQAALMYEGVLRRVNRLGNDRFVRSKNMGFPQNLNIQAVTIADLKNEPVLLDIDDALDLEHKPFGLPLRVDLF